MRKIPRVGDDMLTIDDVMSMLNLSRSTILGLHNNYLHPVKVDGRLFYRRDEVDAEMERRQTSNKILKRTNVDIRPKSTAKTVVDSVKPSVVAKPPTYDGKTAAQAARLFRDGSDRRDVVEKLEITFELADHLWLQFMRMGTEIVLDRAATAGLGKSIDLPLNPTARDIVELVGALSDSVHQRAIEYSVTLFGRSPRVRYARKAGRIFVDVLLGIDQADGEWGAERIRKVDVTDVIQMTPEEIEYAGWLGMVDEET
jgi:Helix-turn-helix domain